ncbi:MAG: cytochrome b [Variovorax sp.]
MNWRNTADAYGKASMLFHWITAAAFVSAYVIVYYVIWIVDPETSVKPALLGLVPDPQRVIPLLNIHWILGITIGTLTLPRLVWRLSGGAPRHVAGSRLEHLAADAAHWALYAFLIVMPVSGYMTTYHPTDFGLFTIPPCRDTAWAGWIRNLFAMSVQDLEDLMWAIHSFCGKWLAWPLVLVHIGAALVHHFERRDAVLRRMLPLRRTD